MSLALGALLLALHSFRELAATLHDGHEVRAVFDLHACTRPSEDGSGDRPGPEAVLGMTLRSWELIAAGVVRNPQAYVVASESALSHRASGSFMQKFTKVKVFADDSVEIYTAILDPEALDVVAYDTFRCTIDHGASFYVGGSG